MILSSTPTVFPGIRAVAGRVQRALGSVDENGSRAGEDVGASLVEDSPTSEPSALERAAERVRYDPEAADFEPVIAALDDDDRERRKLAAKALAGVPSSASPSATEAIPVLVRRLDDELTVRLSSARALAELAPADPGEVVARAPALVEHLSDHNQWVSRNVARTLGVAARSAPDDVAPLVFPSVGREVAYATRRNALVVLHEAARVDPDAVAPIVPDLVDLLGRLWMTQPGIVRTLAAVAGEHPSAVAPAVPDLVDLASDGDGAVQESAIEALVEVAVREPAAARPAVAVLANHLTRVEPTHGHRAGAALARIVERHPEDRDRVLAALGTVDASDRLRAARILSATGGATGSELADDALEGSPLRRYLDR